MNIHPFGLLQRITTKFLWPKLFSKFLCTSCIKLSGSGNWKERRKQKRDWDSGLGKILSLLDNIR